MKNVDTENEEYLDFKNLNNPSNNFMGPAGAKGKFYGGNNQMMNLNLNNNFNINNNNNEDYILSKNATAENLWADPNFTYAPEGSNNMMFPGDYMMPNNINNRGRQFFNPMNNFGGVYEGMNPNQGKINTKNSMGFKSNSAAHNVNNNFNSVPIMQNKINNMNPNVLMNKGANASNANNNFAIGNMNNLRYNLNRQGSQNMPMENAQLNNNNNLNINSNKNFNKTFGVNNNNNNFNMQASSPVNNTIDHNTMLNMKLSKNISNYTELSNEELAKNALIISKDQCGCRFIQKKISENSDFSNNFLYPAVINLKLFDIINLQIY